MIKDQRRIIGLVNDRSPVLNESVFVQKLFSKNRDFTKGKLMPTIKRIPLLGAFILIFLLNLFFPTIGFSQCNPSISISGGSTTFCIDQNVEIGLSVNVKPPNSLFTGTGVTDNNALDSLATFNPSVAGIGTHAITYVVNTAGDNCLITETDTIFLTVNPIPNAGSDSTAMVCSESGAFIDLFTYLKDAPDNTGHWDTISGVSPTGYLGKLTDANLATLGAGMHTFTYKVLGNGICKDSTAQIALTIINPPMPASVNAIGAICAGNRAAVTVNGLAAGNYSVSYLINGISQMPENMTSNGVTGTFNTRALTVADNGLNFTLRSISNIDITPSCTDTMTFTQVLSVTASPIFEARDTAICQGADIDLSTLLNINVAGDSLVYGTAYGNYNFGRDSFHTPAVTTTYYVRDSFGTSNCADTATITVSVYAQPNITGRDTAICNGESVNLSFLINGDTTDFLQYGSGSGFGSYAFGANIAMPPLGSTNYYVRDSINPVCLDTALIVVTVNPQPDLAARDTTICNGESIDLSLLISQTMMGDGVVYGTAYGNYSLGTSSTQSPTSTTVYYLRDSSAATGCVDTTRLTVSVNPAPVAGSISGSNTLCMGSSNTLTAHPSGGTGTLTVAFSSSNTGVATINSTTGVVNSVSIGSTNITYTVTDMNGCSTTSANFILNVTTIPTANAVTGPNEVCLGTSITVTGNPSLGTTPYADTSWISADPTIASIDGDGVITGNAAGNTTVHYVITDANGCTATSGTFPISVNAPPTAGNILGGNRVCKGTTLNLNSNVSGGTPTYSISWLSSNPAKATVDVNGIVTALDTGMVDIRYAVTDSKTCAAISNAHQVIIDSIPNPILSISDSDTTICVGDTVLFTGANGNEYEFLLNGQSLGAASTTNTYQTDSLKNNDTIQMVVYNAMNCSDTSGMIIMNVNPLPSATLVSNDADNAIKLGQTIIFTATGGTMYEFFVNDTTRQALSTVDTFPIATLKNLDTVMVEVTNANGCKDTATLVITVNNPPIAVNDTVKIDEDISFININVQANDSDPESDNLTTAIITSPIKGTAILQNADSIRYLPFAHANGLDSLSYSICDAFTNCDTAVVYIEITPINDAPIANNDTIQIMEDAGLTVIDVQANDIDVDGDTMRTQFVAGGSKGSVSVSMDSLIHYTPSPDSNGVDIIVYNVCDTSFCSHAIVYIEITPKNDAPIAVKDSVFTTEDTTMVTFAILANDIDIDVNDTIKATILSGPTSGSMASISDDTLLVYKPDSNFFGIDTVVYQICDTSMACDADTVIITVAPKSDAPIAVDDFISINEDTSNVVINVQINDSDPDGDSFVTTIVSANMMVDTLNGDSIIVTPPANVSGLVELIGYKICDSSGLCDTGIVTVTLLPVNDAPVANNDLVILTMDTSNAGIAPLVNDIDVDDPTLTITMITTTAKGGATINAAKDSIFYTPMSGFSGLDTIEYIVCDTSMACDTGLVLLTVGFVNTPPVAVNDTITGITEDMGAVLVRPLLNDSDVNGVGDTLKIQSLTTPASGATVTILNDTAITYVPALNFNGKDSLMYSVCDTSNGCVTAWIFLTINPVNDAPMAIGDTAFLNMDTMNALINVKMNDLDVDGDALTVSLLGPSAKGITATVVNDSIRYSPPTSFVGRDTLMYRVSDGTLTDDAILVIIIADPNNVPPVANADFATTTPMTSIIVDVQANDMDANGNTFITNILSGPKAGNIAAVLNGDSIQYTPAMTFAGNDTIVYQICDPSLACDSDTLFVRVENNLSATVHVLLKGAFDRNTGLMHDSLRKKGLIPMTEPYSTLPHIPNGYQFVHKNGGGGETISNPATVLSDKGANSIVDWVYLELLTAADTMPVASRAALLQRNGKVVDTDGVSPVRFMALPNGNYFLSIRHRSHLGVMTRSAVNFTMGSTPNINFTNFVSAGGTPAYGNFAMDTIQNRTVLWGGDGNGDRKIIYEGSNNDRNPIFHDVLTDPMNTGHNYNHISRGYKLSNYNLKGASIYVGSGNDPDIIFFNVFSHPGNILKSRNFIIYEQIYR